MFRRPIIDDWRSVGGVDGNVSDSQVILLVRIFCIDARIYQGIRDVHVRRGDSCDVGQQ